MLNTVIDLSHNNTIDPANGFHAIAGAGIQAIIHKATQGTGMVDSTYAARKVRALAMNIFWGAYHFADKGDPVAQADHFIAITQGIPMRVLDWETNDMTYSGAVAFVNRVHAVSGRFPLLYSGSSFLTDQLHAQGVTTPDTTTLSKCPLWLARYSKNPPVVPAAWPHGFTLWQYSSTEKVPGISGNVDRDYFNGDHAAMKTLFGA
jgi:lysozyme